MSASLETKKDIARFFSVTGLRVAPNAADGLLAELRKFQHHEEKLRFMHKFMALFKEYQALTTKTTANSGMAIAGMGQGAVLDANIAA